MPDSFELIQGIGAQCQQSILAFARVCCTLVIIRLQATILQEIEVHECLPGTLKTFSPLPCSLAAGLRYSAMLWRKLCLLLLFLLFFWVGEAQGLNRTVDDTSAIIQYSSGWSSVSPSLIATGSFFNNTLKTTTTAGSTATYAFQG